MNADKEKRVERFVAEDVNEFLRLRLKRFSSENICRKIIAKRHPELTVDVVTIKAAGMSSAMRSALGFLETREGGLNSKILSRYYAILQITIAEQIASKDPAENLSSAQSHTEYGHGLFSIRNEGEDFLDNFYLGALSSGHFHAYLKSLGYDISKYVCAKRQRKFQDAELAKMITLADLIRRVPDMQSSIKEYFGKDPLSFHIGHSRKNLIHKAMLPESSEVQTTFVDFYVKDYSISPQELNSHGFEVINILANSVESLDYEGILVGEIQHPKNSIWWNFVQTYKSGYCGTSVMVPFWGLKDPLVLHLVILYAFSIIVRYLPEVWHEVEHGKLNHINSLLEHYLLVLDNVLPKLAVERLSDTKVMISSPGGLTSPI